MSYPEGYEWLGNVGPLPRVIQEGLKEYGVIEGPGTLNNPKILAWAKELGMRAVYTADSIPWCGLFVALICKRSKKPKPKQPLWALSWANYGKKVGQPILGDILVFTRDGGGHVGFYIGEDQETFHVLGGNQNNAVSIKRIYKKRLYAARRPYFQFRLPESARPYNLSSVGEITTDEA